jgi:hypothetical protein
MIRKSWEFLGGVTGLAILAGGLIWLGDLRGDVTALQDDMDEIKNGISELQPQKLAIGARGQNCIAIVDRLARAAENKDVFAQEELEKIADKWGCSMMPSSFEKDRDSQNGMVPTLQADSPRPDTRSGSPGGQQSYR